FARGDYDALVHALGPALERRRPLVQRAHDAHAHGDVVLDDVELADLGRAIGRRKDHPVGARDADLAPAGVDEGFGRAHPDGFYTLATGPSGVPLRPPRPPWPSRCARAARR